MNSIFRWDGCFPTWVMNSWYLHTELNCFTNKTTTNFQTLVIITNIGTIRSHFKSSFIKPFSTCLALVYWLRFSGQANWHWIFCQMFLRISYEIWFPDEGTPSITWGLNKLAKCRRALFISYYSSDYPSGIAAVLFICCSTNRTNRFNSILKQPWRMCL